MKYRRPFQTLISNLTINKIKKTQNSPTGATPRYFLTRQQKPFPSVAVLKRALHHAGALQPVLRLFKRLTNIAESLSQSAWRIVNLPCTNRREKFNLNNPRVGPANKRKTTDSAAGRRGGGRSLDSITAWKNTVLFGWVHFGEVLSVFQQQNTYVSLNWMMTSLNLKKNNLSFVVPLTKSICLQKLSFHENSSDLIDMLTFDWSRI